MHTIIHARTPIRSNTSLPPQRTALANCTMSAVLSSLAKVRLTLQIIHVERVLGPPFLAVRGRS